MQNNEARMCGDGHQLIYPSFFFFFSPPKTFLVNTEIRFQTDIIVGVRLDCAPLQNAINGQDQTGTRGLTLPVLGQGKCLLKLMGAGWIGKTG